LPEFQFCPESNNIETIVALSTKVTNCALKTKLHYNGNAPKVYLHQKFF
jgi:hypothetical protein